MLTQLWIWLLILWKRYSLVSWFYFVGLIYFIFMCWYGASGATEGRPRQPNQVTRSVPRAPARMLDTLPRVAATPHALRAKHWARLELCRVRLRTAVVGADVSDVVDGWRGVAPLQQRSPVSPPTVLLVMVMSSRSARHAIFGISLTSTRYCSHHARMPRMLRAKF